MRKHVVAALAMAAIAIPGMSAAQDARQGWTYAYTDGVATATQTDNRNHVAVTLTCRPPDGDILITDYTLARNARRADHADVRIGNLSVHVPMTLQGRGRNATVVIHLPQRPPILAGAQPTDQLSVTVNNQTATYQGASAMQLKDVAYACWGS